MSKKTCLTFKETSHNVVCLKFYDLKIDKIYSLADIKKNFNFESTCNWREYLESLTDSLTTVDNEVCKTEVLTDSKKQALIAFFHCFGNCFHGSSGFELAISTTLKIGSGTGSSASFSVVLAAAKLIYENYLKDKNSISKVIER